MSHNIEFPQEVNHLVNERQQIWSELDAARNRSSQLNQLTEKIGGLSGTLEEVKQPFTQNPDPRIEIDRVIKETNTQLGELGKIDVEIKSAESEIQAIKSRAMTMMFSLVAGLVVVVVVFMVVVSRVVR